MYHTFYFTNKFWLLKCYRLDLTWKFSCTHIIIVIIEDIISDTWGLLSESWLSLILSLVSVLYHSLSNMLLLSTSFQIFVGLSLPFVPCICSSSILRTSLEPSQTPFLSLISLFSHLLEPSQTPYLSTYGLFPITIFYGYLKIFSFTSRHMHFFLQFLCCHPIISIWYFSFHCCLKKIFI